MKLASWASHTVDLDLLPPELPTVLDVGCRDFDFTEEAMGYRPSSFIVACDPSPEVASQEGRRLVNIFEPMALVGKERNMAMLAMHSTGEGNFICDDPPWFAAAAVVRCITLAALMDKHGVKFWDLVKLDCEGSEFGILENWPGPVAQQISVEFHDWTGPWEEYVSGDYYERLFAGPLKDYEVVQHELSKQGEGIGHWDSLLRLRCEKATR
jgi:FkbM family methyltransferase